VQSKDKIKVIQIQKKKKKLKRGLLFFARYLLVHLERRADKPQTITPSKQTNIKFASSFHIKVFLFFFNYKVITSITDVFLI